MDEALIDLQTRVAFQEESIQALNRALLDQQQVINALQAELETVHQRLRALTPSPLESDAVEPPPPHY
ncbi:SlyX [Candidatus Endoriftia persephone str. Guaymas]|jgi:SlyX protein|uniref:Protein SlyX homolog n=4 Tax=Gammaproteobacteria TaxID=1236 RepID=G2FIC4_9GAMM|nr:SlyX family protein [Candidatus Endoriftia persephone]MBA1330620.1 SlyX [Candidatus Endoriftia persephone str. Guaymas]EGV52874.1 hypothetical protein Rifp1Sym_aa00320 [endosymbiont of Riftia pachyptila (vent Ph05)]EGW53477.1 hypothetical protein TevJSym_bb00320 [endosymbiont of Tevnia jerichonana (vent Tica)]KRT56156.1 putative coiled-coil protein SlyX (sensitive to lysis X) [endosymbiont of Ridgeia piscesae]KRT59996.1 SlyX protein [endosymbiont of Ridgeia piscesae]